MMTPTQRRLCDADVDCIKLQLARPSEDASIIIFTTSLSGRWFGKVQVIFATVFLEFLLGLKNLKQQAQAHKTCLALFIQLEAPDMGVQIASISTD